ncbi:cystathionine beta-l [Terfezia boudieri ATCC MYA-4762]|uniref:Cystathionine beta-lyase n=1 Tax=Terfezia boudieri ATCC MYA-4762 TaxID=1051890 RepID=A0A3N4LT10_9PEZI|nr:cystathionine beta-l [Terfezia boudieri ATCC MYA-4762]
MDGPAHTEGSERPAEGVLARAFRHTDLEGHDLPPSPTPSSPRNGRRYAMATELVYTEHGDQYHSSSVPIYQTATFKQTSSRPTDGAYDYTRSGNPTRSHLERHLSKITSSHRCLVVSSGMASMDVITRLLSPGDHVIAGDDLYGGSNRLLKYLSTHSGITVHHLDTTTPLTSFPPILTAHSQKVKLVLLESPTNPLIKICDIPLISTLVHTANPTSIVVVDNTMLSPYLCNPLLLGADIVYESATKYLSGHHDLMAGIIYTNSPPLASRLAFTINASGCALSPFDSFLLLRGIKTLSVRLDKQLLSSHAIAVFLEQTCGFRVRYPGLPSHPQHDLHSRLSPRGAGAVLSFETGDVSISEKIVENTRLWAISVSFGCVNSLISLPCAMSHASIDKKVREERGMPEDLIRLCVGIEDVNDLIDDLTTALVKAGAVKVTVDGICPLSKAEREKLQAEAEGKLSGPGNEQST